jgi:hypothetical protein
VRLTTPHRIKQLVTKCNEGPRTWSHSLDKRPKLRKTNIRFCTWNVRILYSTDRLERILMIVYAEQNSQNFSGLFPSSGIPKNMMFRKLDLFPSSGEGGEKTPTQLGPLERLE